MICAAPKLLTGFADHSALKISYPAFLDFSARKFIRALLAMLIFLLPEIALSQDKSCQLPGVHLDLVVQTQLAAKIKFSSIYPDIAENEESPFMQPLEIARIGDIKCGFEANPMVISVSEMRGFGEGLKLFSQLNDYGKARDDPRKPIRIEVLEKARSFDGYSIYSGWIKYQIPLAAEHDGKTDPSVYNFLATVDGWREDQFYVSVMCTWDADQHEGFEDLRSLIRGIARPNNETVPKCP